MNRYRLKSCGCLFIELDKVLDAQSVDIDIVCDVLTREIQTEIETISSNGFGELDKGDVVLQIELLVLTVLLQQWPDILQSRAVANGQWRILRLFFLLVDRNAQVAQRFHSPEEIADENNGKRLGPSGKRMPLS